MDDTFTGESADEYDAAGNVRDREYDRVRIGFCAPTGRAASRLAESTGYSAITLHRMLGVHRDGTVRFNATNHLEFDLIVVDEASMVDARLLDMYVSTSVRSPLSFDWFARVVVYQVVRVGVRGKDVRQRVCTSGGFGVGCSFDCPADRCHSCWFVSHGSRDHDLRP